MASRILTAWHRVADRIGCVPIRVIIAVGVSLLMFCFGGVVTYGVRAKVAEIMWEEHRKTAISTARAVEEHMSMYFVRESASELRERFRRWADANQDVAYVLVADASPTVLVDKLRGGFPSELWTANTVAKGERFHVALVGTADGPVWDVAIPISDKKGSAVRVGISRSHTQGVIDGITYFLLGLTGSAAVLGALAAFLLASWIVKPILQLASATTAFGAGEVQRRVPVRGSDEVARLAASFNAMADSLERSQRAIEEANRQLVRNNTGLSAFNAVARAASRPPDLDDILNHSLEEVRMALNVKVGWILLKDNDGRLKLAAAKGFAEASPPDEVEIIPEKCACRQTLSGGQTRVVDGSPVCLRGGLELLQREGLDCHASVPLKAKTKVLGIMNLAYPADRQFGEDDIELLNSIGHQIGMAVENARLYEDVRRKEVGLINAYEEERTRVARELHDEAGQSLTALLLQLGSFEELLPPDADQARRRLGELQAHTAGIVQELRQLMMDLRPTLLDHLGLIPAVRSLAESQLQRAGVQIGIKVQGERRRLAPATEIALFRILQEAITNIAKHAKARLGTVELSFNDDSVAACIVDDGRGFDPVASRAAWRTFGLIGMEERVSLLGGTLRIESQANQGTRISLEIPTPPA
jgi:signal transduction histidine kinase